MNSYEAFLFNQLLEVNYEIEAGNHKSLVKLSLINTYSKLVAQLEDSMGEAEWKQFRETGRQMFAPVGGYGDESPDEVRYMMKEVGL